MLNFLKNKIYGGNNIIHINELRYLPRWIVLFIDVVLLGIATLCAYFFLKRFGIAQSEQVSLLYTILPIMLVNMVCMYIYKTFAGVIRHSTFIDLLKILLSSVTTVILVGFIDAFLEIFGGKQYFPLPFLVIYFSLSIVLLFLFRLAVKQFFHFAREFKRSANKMRVLVLGIDEQSIAIARAIMDNFHLPYHVVGFLTKDISLRRVKILGKSIFRVNQLKDSLLKDLNINAIIVIRESVTHEEINYWASFALDRKLKIYKVPSVSKVREGDLNNSIRVLQLEDLLNRRPIVIENEEVSKRHYQKNILITGGAGSIGSELVRQVALFEPSMVVVLDQAETPLYEVELEMKEAFPNINFKFVLGDISSYSRLENLFDECQFSVVYHAAAYKHVPLMEEHPREAVRVNIQGSKNLALLSSKYKVNRFVMVSTDKAVNPTNVMGASKRVAELFVQALQNKEGNTTKFITTRFGNVLGSNGSVIPHFKKQIEKGGPITITHPDIVRYFMTIPEACELVLEAGAMGSGGEIFVFDMGEPVKILDLAKRMIKLSGYEPDEDIKIIYTGLRPGEKLYEELLSDSSKNLPTHHNKIMISKDEQMGYQEIDRYTQLISEQVKKLNNFEIVKILKEVVKEFKSNNSIYEFLDEKSEN